MADEHCDVFNPAPKLTALPVAAPAEEMADFVDRVPSEYPLQVGVSYLGAKRPDARRVVTDLTDTHVTYTHPPSYRSRETVTREEFTDWAVEIYLGHPDMPLPVPDGVEL